MSGKLWKDPSEWARLMVTARLGHSELVALFHRTYIKRGFSYRGFMGAAHKEAHKWGMTKPRQRREIQRELEFW